MIFCNTTPSIVDYTLTPQPFSSLVSKYTSEYTSTRLQTKCRREKVYFHSGLFLSLQLHHFCSCGSGLYALCCCHTLYICVCGTFVCVYITRKIPCTYSQKNNRKYIVCRCRFVAFVPVCAIVLLCCCTPLAPCLWRILRTFFWVFSLVLLPLRSRANVVCLHFVLFISVRACCILYPCCHTREKPPSSADCSCNSKETPVAAVRHKVSASNFNKISPLPSSIGQFFAQSVLVCICVYMCLVCGSAVCCCC